MEYPIGFYCLLTWVDFVNGSGREFFSLKVFIYISIILKVISLFGLWTLRIKPLRKKKKINKNSSILHQYICGMHFIFFFKYSIRRAFMEERPSYFPLAPTYLTTWILNTDFKSRFCFIVRYNDLFEMLEKLDLHRKDLGKTLETNGLCENKQWIQRVIQNSDKFVFSI